MLENRVKSECSELKISVEDTSIEEKLFNLNLENSLNEKFRLLFNEKIGLGKICYLNVRINKSEYSTITSSSGDTSRVNRKLMVSYSLKTNKKQIDSRFIIFYGSDVSKYVYSDYMKIKKEDINNVKNITNKLYFEVIKNI